MKNTILILALVLLSTLTSFASANTLTGNTLSDYGNYTLKKSSNYTVIDNVAHKTWNLSYENGKSYTVFSTPGKDGTCCFTVKGENFEIRYVKNEIGFGVKLVDGGKRTVKKRDVMNQIEYDNFVNQLVLTTKDKSEDEYLGLVASFMPLLFG